MTTTMTTTTTTMGNIGNCVVDVVVRWWAKK